MPLLRQTIAALCITTVMAAAPVLAAPDKVLHMFLSTSETGLDPAVASDLARAGCPADARATSAAAAPSTTAQLLPAVCTPPG